MEGTNLALSAVAEVLAKMDERLTKEEEEDRIDEEEKAIEAEKSDLVKAVASEVVSMIKEENPLGMDVDGSKERKAKAAAPQYDDAQSAANPTTKIEDQQSAIQAADLEDEDDEDTKKTYKAEDDEDNGSDEEPVDKAEDADEDENGDKKYNFDKAEDDDEELDDDGMKAMRKELDALRKTVAAYEANMEKAIEEQSVTRLRKMGFREENGLQRPALMNNNEALGTDGTTPIVKGATSGTDVVEDLSGLSYKQLRDLQHKIDTGNTAGVPRELLR